MLISKFITILNLITTFIYKINIRYTSKQAKFIKNISEPQQITITTSSNSHYLNKHTFKAKESLCQHSNKATTKDNYRFLILIL